MYYHCNRTDRAVHTSHNTYTPHIPHRIGAGAGAGRWSESDSSEEEVSPRPRQVRRTAVPVGIAPSFRVPDPPVAAQLPQASCDSSATTQVAATVATAVYVLSARYSLRLTPCSSSLPSAASPSRPALCRCRRSTATWASSSHPKERRLCRLLCQVPLQERGQLRMLELAVLLVALASQLHMPKLMLLCMPELRGCGSSAGSSVSSKGRTLTAAKAPPLPLRPRCQLIYSQRPHSTTMLLLATQR